MPRNNRIAESAVRAMNLTVGRTWSLVQNGLRQGNTIGATFCTVSSPAVTSRFTPIEPDGRVRGVEIVSAARWCAIA